MAMSSSTGSLMAACLPTKLSSSPPASLSSSNSLFFSGVGSVRLAARRSRPRDLRCRCLFGLGVPEIAVIAGVAALVFGPSQIPEVGRSFGKTIKSFQQVPFLPYFSASCECFRFNRIYRKNNDTVL
ncbi:sec-independent protein translocase protein TATA, chloroplastic [Cocos nucifera]|nr:sec-independent protein translocase protein TATA, chloroplastic [Cocos nucifera]